MQRVILRVWISNSRQAWCRWWIEAGSDFPSRSAFLDSLSNDIPVLVSRILAVGTSMVSQGFNVYCLLKKSAEFNPLYYRVGRTFVALVLIKPASVAAHATISTTTANGLVRYGDKGGRNRSPLCSSIFDHHGQLIKEAYLAIISIVLPWFSYTSWTWLVCRISNVSSPHDHAIFRRSRSHLV